jgi:elongation factor G
VRAGLRAADAALFVVSAVDGVDGMTRMLWEECAAVGMPRAVVVTHLDQQRADFDEALAVCQRVFGDGVQPLYLPLLDDDEAPGGLIGLLSQKVFDLSSGARLERDADPQHLELIEGPRTVADRGDHPGVRGRQACSTAGWPARRSRSTPSSRTWRRPSRAAPSTPWSRRTR